jgi:hypothetical protein
MRFFVSMLATLLLSACHFMPDDLEALAESIGEQVSGEATAWLVGGDVVLIDVAGSPLFGVTGPELETVAAGIAEQAIDYTDAALVSVAVTFHQGPVSDDPEKQREFIFLVSDGRPTLQPLLDFDATGPLTSEEVQALFIDPMGETLAIQDMDCIMEEVDRLTREAGDPESLDPAAVEFLPTDSWSSLDAFGRRLVLAQAITTNALFSCT